MLRNRAPRTISLALSAGLSLFAFILFVSFAIPATQAEPILDSYGRITGFTEPDEVPLDPKVAEPEPDPKPLDASEANWEVDALIEELRQRITEKDERIKSLNQQAGSISNDLESARGRERTLSGQVAYLNRQIDALDLQIRITENQVDAQALKIEALGLEIARHETEIETARERLGEVLRTMQVTEDQIGPVGLVFAARPFSEVFDALRASELLDATLGQSLQGVKQAKADIEAAREQSIEEREEAESLRDELRIRKTLLASEEVSRDVLLDETRQEESSYRDLLAEVEAQQREIEQEIRELESQLRRTIDPASLPGAGVLTWPVDNVRITQGYGDTSSTGFVNDVYNFHNGIDIGASVRGVIGDPIRTAAPGHVVGAGSTGRYAYGRWVAVDHLNGLVTLYAHLSLQQVSVGQEVQRGTVIGRMGNTGFSTGAHLHFTVYAEESFRIESRWYGPLPIGASFDPIQFL